MKKTYKYKIFTIKISMHRGYYSFIILHKNKELITINPSLTGRLNKTIDELFEEAKSFIDRNFDIDNMLTNESK